MINGLILVRERPCYSLTITFNWVVHGQPIPRCYMSTGFFFIKALSRELAFKLEGTLKEDAFVLPGAISPALFNGLSEKKKKTFGWLTKPVKVSGHYERAPD